METKTATDIKCCTSTWNHPINRYSVNNRVTQELVQIKLFLGRICSSNSFTSMSLAVPSGILLGMHIISDGWKAYSTLKTTYVAFWGRHIVNNIGIPSHIAITALSPYCHVVNNIGIPRYYSTRSKFLLQASYTFSFYKQFSPSVSAQCCLRLAGT